jgi:hypothetical protein
MARPAGPTETREEDPEAIDVTKINGGCDKSYTALIKEASFIRCDFDRHIMRLILTSNEPVSCGNPPSDVPAPKRGEKINRQSKKKGCKEKKCSNWKGGKCRCGRD